MTDRVDIDALLIGALYGELTPAEEARLTTHLESHPADRTALADLGHTRTAIRESRILSVQLEPPQSVSALLLQEAARRAPKPAREGVGGWFYRFTRSFMMHPAMAAAAMLVLVVGVAGTMYLRHGDQFAETAPPATTTAAASDEARAQAVAQEKAAVAAEAERQTEKIAAVAARAPAETGRADDDKNSGAGVESGSAAGADSYRVGLDEPASQPAPPAAATPPAQVAQDDRQAPAGRAKASTTVLGDGEVNQAKEEAKDAKRTEAQERPLDLPARPAAPMPAKIAAKGNAGLGVELPGPEMAPKDLDDEADRPTAKKQDVARRDRRNADTANDRMGKFAADKVAMAPGAAPAGGGAGAPVAGMMPPQHHAAAADLAADPEAVIASNATSNTITGGSSAGARSKAPAKPAPRPAPARSAPAPAQRFAPPPAAATAEPPDLQRDNRRLADKTATLADAGPMDEKAEKPGEDRALLDWAQKQRDQVLAFVKSSNCRAAAKAAMAIYNRAPGYYAANIETDRSIKPCIAYVNNEREREERSRAAMKRANAADTPATAPPRK